MPETSELQQMFQALVELTEALHWEMDLASGRKFTYVSPQIERILGYPPSKWDTFESWADTVHPDDREYAVGCRLEKTENSEDHVFNYRVLNAEGKTIWIQDVVKVISKDDKPVKMFGVMFDITGQKRAEIELRTLTAIFHNLAEGVCLIGADDLAIKWVNPVFEKMFGYDRGELTEIPVDTVIAPTDRTPEETRESIVKVLEETGEWHGEVRNIKKDGTQFWCRANISLLDHPEYGNVFVSVNTDITERKETEEVLKFSERKYRAIISNSPIGIVVCNADGQCISTNNAMANIIGATKEQILKQNYHDLESWKRSGLYAKAISAVKKRRTEHLDVELVSSFGKKVYLSSYFTPFASGELLVMMQDISELLKTQKELGKALHDKDILMKELQHRTKNNLSILQSLLSLQAREISDEKSREHFSDAKNRVASMALIYEILNRVDVVTGMSSSEYIRKLVDMLFHNFKLSSQTIRLQCDIEDITMDVDTMIPLGLIINELVTNALKYAFPDGTEGTLSIFLKAAGKGNAHYELVVKDTGVGLPEEFDFENTTSLGLRIVSLLVRQIKGTLQVSKTGGAEFRINFAEKSIA